MAKNFIPPVFTDIPDGATITWGTQMNERLQLLADSVAGLALDLGILLTGVFGAGRLGAGGAPQTTSALALQLSPSAGQPPVRYLVEGQVFEFEESETVVLDLPAGLQGALGFASIDPDDPTRLVVLADDWYPSTITLAQKAALLASGKPCIGQVTTSAIGITAYDASACSVIESASALSLRQDALEARISILEGGEAGEGSGGPSGASYASLLPFEREIDGTPEAPADIRATSIVVRDFFELAKAYTDEAVATGGIKLHNPPLDLVFEHLALLWDALADLAPGVQETGPLTLIKLRRWGDGTAGSPDLRGYSTGVVNEETLEVEPGP